MYVLQKNIVKRYNEGQDDKNGMFNNAFLFSKVLCWDTSSLSLPNGVDYMFSSTNGARFDPIPFPDCLKPNQAYKTKMFFAPFAFYLFNCYLLEIM